MKDGLFSEKIEKFLIFLINSEKDDFNLLEVIKKLLILF